MTEIAYQIYQNTDLQKLSCEISEIDIFYYWDWECEFNFLSSLRNKSLFQKVLNYEKKLVLITPHMSEKSIEYFKSFIYSKNPDFLDAFDEIIINDLWVLHLIQNGPKNWNIQFVFWNYMFNQRKDPLLKYSTHKLIPSSVVNINLKLYNSYLEKNDFTAIELYNSFWDISIKNLESMKTYLYYPYVVYATSRHCYRSLIDEEKQKLQIVDSCTWCKDKEHISFYQDVDEELKIYTRWNKYFYENTDDTKTKKVDRIIYNYDIIHS